MNEDLVYLEQIQSQISDLSRELVNLQKDIEHLYVFGQDVDKAEKSVKVRLFMCRHNLKVEK